MSRTEPQPHNRTMPHALQLMPIKRISHIWALSHSARWTDTNLRRSRTVNRTSVNKRTEGRITSLGRGFICEKILLKALTCHTLQFQSGLPQTDSCIYRCYVYRHSLRPQPRSAYHDARHQHQLCRKNDDDVIHLPSCLPSPSNTYELLSLHFTSSCLQFASSQRTCCSSWRHQQHR